MIISRLVDLIVTACFAGLASVAQGSDLVPGDLYASTDQSSHFIDSVSTVVSIGSSGTVRHTDSGRSYLAGSLATGKIAFAQTCGDGGSTTSATEDGKKISISLDGSDTWHTPIWAIDNSDPPLSVKRAAGIASAWAKHKHPAETTKIDSIMLRSIHCFDGSDRWYYFFDFATVREARRTHEFGNWLVVLMDGSVVESTVDAGG